VALTAEALAASDAVVIVTDHTAIDYQLIADHAALVIDTRNAMSRTRGSRARIVHLAAPSAEAVPVA
jgi:UDP-N-acetyl-D-glucosamine dehydrogenase